MPKTQLWEERLKKDIPLGVEIPLNEYIDGKQVFEYCFQDLGNDYTSNTTIVTGLPTNLEVVELKAAFDSDGTSGYVDNFYVDNGNGNSRSYLKYSDDTGTINAIINSTTIRNIRGCLKYTKP